MPKKHQPAYASIRPTHSRSTTTPRATTSTAPQQSVNDRIQQLRREQAPRTTTQRRDEITEVVTTRTVPPHLRRLLQLAEGEVPKPKPGSRHARNIGASRPGERRPPGPAAPNSWLSASRFAPKGMRNGEGDGTLDRREGFGRLARCYDEEFRRFPAPKSLMHQCLRTFASHWGDLAEYEQHYLPSLPIPLREVMLSYLTLYSMRGDLDSKTFKILFQDDKEVEGGTSAWSEVRFLDLTGMLSEKFTLKDLDKSLHHVGGVGVATAAVTSSVGDLNLSSDSPKGKGKEKMVPQIAESWEDEVEDVSKTPPPASIPGHTLLTPVFPNLTRLSLAHPGPTASWTDLLSLSPHLKMLTHLSLAYWPRPSTTPNAATASMVSQHGSVSLGGSHFYSDLDDDWHEAANILRRLSKNTYCLQWLDLEGCTWIPALTWDPNGGIEQYQQPRLSASSSEDDWPTSPSSSSTKPNRYTPTGPDWTTSWRQITHLNLSQAWIPSSPQSLQTLPSGIICVRLMNWLREQERLASPPFSLSSDRSHAEVARWVEREKVGRSVGTRVQAVRKAVGGLWCVIDYGWG
ncbi:hypothetical protein DM02DRAFT_542298 [Periconia macrospinosa]|uniref:Tafazzin n=1 Tax=Periconia macrospinosa TaxID=97972 RepID=A0A2V1D4X0_9PLEO|nr:hypothetical protein DM02DRAFT_542298 [Periconia macrospinosa]